MGKRNKRKAEGLPWVGKNESLHKPKVHFIFQAPDANEVYVAGEFNGWHTHAAHDQGRKWHVECDHGVTRRSA